MVKIKHETKTYVVTTAQAFAKPNKNFLKSLENYVDEFADELIILPTIGESARQDWNIENIDDSLKDYHIEYGKLKLNDNIEIDQFNIRPYQIDPLVGLARFSQRETSKIFASPKQRLKYISHSNVKMPRALITPGAITEPNYATHKDTSAERRRLGNIALRDHVYGAWVVDIVNNSKYHHRNIHSMVNGTFVDLGIKFSSNSQPQQANLDALILGDYHNGYTDKKVRKANFDMIKEYKPDRLFLHDFFNGHSISHHMQKELIYQMIREGADKGNLSLDKELRDCNKELWLLANAMEGREVNVIYSNHSPGFLERYLDEGRFIKDPMNARTAFELASAYANGENPLEIGIKTHGGLPENVNFLKMDQDYKLHGIQLANHGNTGPGYGRGSLKTKETDFGKSITGHVHNAGILRNTYTVGTSLPLKVFYMKNNPSGWTNTNAFLWDTGQVQLVNIINGEYKKNNLKFL